jgi:hypothetical protein
MLTIKRYLWVYHLVAAKLAQPNLTQNEIIEITYELAHARGEEPIQLYSCFISYSSNDEEFASRLHTDLQVKGVRCCFAPHDLPIGAKILDGLNAAIRMQDKALLILS